LNGKSGQEEVNWGKRTGGRPEQFHVDLFEGLVSLFQIAASAGRYHIFPDRAATQRFRKYMIDGQLLSAIPPAVLASEVVALEDVLLIEGQGILKGPVNIAIESNDGRKNDHQRRREDDSIRVFHSLRLPRKEQNDGPLGGTDLQGLIRLIQHQDLYLVDHGIGKGIERDI
jgi:hypothetical protein